MIEKDKDGQVWIQDDMPTDLETARIMTCGLEAAYTGDAISGRIRDFTKQLLEALRLEREEIDYSTKYSLKCASWGI